jgi:polyhydroxyalkanoate synthesis regulator phasin
MIILGADILMAGLLAVTKSEMDALNARIDALSHEIDVLAEQRKSR